MHTVPTPDASRRPAAPSPDAGADWKAEILALEEQSRVAFFAADVPTLERLWAEEFVVNSPLHVINDKAGTLELLRTGRIRHATFTVEVERVVRSGDVVIVMGRDTVDGPPAGLRMHRRFTNVWQLRDGTWRTIARHAQIASREQVT